MKVTDALVKLRDELKNWTAYNILQILNDITEIKKNISEINKTKPVKISDLEQDIPYVNETKITLGINSDGLLYVFINGRAVGTGISIDSGDTTDNLLNSGELYLNQRYSMPDNRGKALLTDIGTEELAHIEMISTMIYQLTKDATLEELKEAGMDTHYAEHAKALYPTDANGVPFTVTYFAATGDPLADLYEDMAAEQKARAVYENLIDLTNDPDVIAPLLWLRQREVVHFNRFKELAEYYKGKGY